MHLDLRAFYLYLFQNVIKQILCHIAYIQSIHFVQAYDIQSPWKYFPNTYTISSHDQDGTVQEGCDCTVSYTQQQGCHLSHCR